MRKNVFSLTYFFICLSSGWAQADNLPKNELYINLGAFSSKYLAKGVHWINFDDYIEDKWHGGSNYAPDDDIENKVITTIAYGHRVGNNWFVTLSALTQDYEDRYRTGKIKAGLIGFKYEYMQKEGFSLASGAAIGQAKQTYDNNDPQDKPTAFQINAIEVRIGSQSFAGRLAFGYGFEGLIQAGIGATF